MSKQVPVEVKAFIRAVLLSAPKGVKQTNFPREYEKFASSRIEWHKMGFKDLYEFLLAIPDVARLEYSMKEAQNLVFGVNKKDIYASSHAKKAGMKGTGLKARHPSEWDKKPTNTSPKNKDKQAKIRTVDVSQNAASVKVTVENSIDVDFLPNELGLYGIHIRDLPYGCTKEELEMIFKEYSSLRHCKVIPDTFDISSPKFAFAKFANKEDACRALTEMNGYKLRGAKLKLNKATEQNALKQITNQHKTEGAQKPKASPPKNHVMNPKPQEKKNSQLRNHTNDTCLSEIELSQLYSRYGTVMSVEILSDRCASLNFSTPEEALNTVKNMKELYFNGQQLSLSSPKGSSITIHISDLKPGSAQNLPKRESTISLSCSLPTFDRSATSSSSKDNISIASVSSHQPHGNSVLNNPCSQDRQSQHNLQQHQGQKQQGQQQQQQNNRQSGSSNPSSSLISQTLERNIHLILNKEEMERLCNISGHPIDQRFRGIPNEIDVLVTEVVDACRFWAIIDSKTGNWQQLEKLEHHLQNTSIKKSSVPQRSTLGAGRFTENNVWYRCFVLDVSSDHQHVKVLYTDYGNVEWIPLERFSSLESMYLSLPPQANAFHLAGLEINYSNSSDSLREGAKYLKDLIGDKTLRARRKALSSSAQAHILEVELFDINKSASTSINNLMAATPFVCRIDNLPSSPSSPVAAPNVPQLSSKENGMFKLKITWVQNASHIFYQNAGTEKEENLKQLNAALLTIHVSERVFPRKGEIVCLMLDNLTRRRVEIIETNSVGGVITSAKVRCIDFGHFIKEAQTKHMLKLPSIIHTIPPLALEAYIDNIELPKSFSQWPKEAGNFLIQYRDKVLDGVITSTRNNMKYIELYNSQGECLNKKIMELMHSLGKPPSKLNTPPPANITQSGVARRELGPSPISANSVSPFTGSQGFPSLPTHKESPANSIRPSTASDQRHSQGSDVGFYMPPPPNVSKEIPHRPHETQSKENLPQGTQSINSLPQGMQNINRVQQGAQRLHNLPQGAQSLNSLPQGAQVTDINSKAPLSTPEKLAQHTNITRTQTTSNESAQTNFCSINTTPQVTQATPQVTKVLHNSPGSSPEKVVLNELNPQNNEWLKEKEELLAKRKEQEECIERLTRPSVPKQSTQNLQQLKEKLAKQVRIKELENQVLKLQKEMDSWEGEKASLQYSLVEWLS